MGNCWPKPVDSLPFTTLARPISPGQSRSRDASAAASTDQGGGGRRKVPASGSIVTPNLKIFTLAALKSATRNFRPDTVLGEGGFGRVFKGYIDEKTFAPSKVGVGIPVAVKKSDPESEQGLKEWQAEVKFLGKVSHPNVVKLLGYCWEDTQFLLVYEYMQKGSLETHLFRKGPGDTLPWDIRMKIAIGAARGLAFLHNTEKQVIYRDFKASNILLDSEYNAKLSDFGLAKCGPDNGYSHVTTKVVGTYGYAAPEYMATGHLYVKSDVYGFGVVLLEILTGLRVLDLNRPSGQTNLIDWAKPLLPYKKKVRKLMDPRLQGQYPSNAAFGIAEIILKCLELDPKCRPDMGEILGTLERMDEILVKPKEVRARVKQNHQNVDLYPQHQAQAQARHTYNGSGGGRGQLAHNRHRNNAKVVRSY